MHLWFSFHSKSVQSRSRSCFARSVYPLSATKCRTFSPPTAECSESGSGFVTLSACRYFSSGIRFVLPSTCIQCRMKDIVFWHVNDIWSWGLCHYDQHKTASQIPNDVLKMLFCCWCQKSPSTKGHIIHVVRILAQNSTYSKMEIIHFDWNASFMLITMVQIRASYLIPSPRFLAQYIAQTFGLIPSPCIQRQMKHTFYLGMWMRYEAGDSKTAKTTFCCWSHFSQSTKGSNYIIHGFSWFGDKLERTSKWTSFQSSIHADRNGANLSLVSHS